MSDRETVVGRHGGILEDIVQAVLEPLGEGQAGIAVEDVRVGVFYSAVKLSTGHGGMAYTPSEELPLEHGARHSYMPRAGNLSALTVDELAKLAYSTNLLESAVGLAAVNALAEMRYAQGYPDYREVRDADLLDLLDLKARETVTMVGAFPFFIRKLRGTVANLHVTERNPRAFVGYPLVPAERQGEVLSVADVVLITAETLVNHTLDEILPLCSRARAIALVGPTAPLYPEPMFRRGVTVVAGTHIANADGLLRSIGEGGTGGHLWAAGAVKVNLLPA